MKKGFLVAMVLIISLLVTSSVGVASSIDYWTINYAPGAPSPYNQNDDLFVSYYGMGFIGYVSSISGTNGRGLSIIAKNAGGLKNNVSATTTGYTVTFETKNAISGDVNFLVSAFYGYTCQSTGYIRINN